VQEVEVRDAALRALLAQNPDALVAAIGHDGRFVPMPDSVPLTGHRVAQARSAVDLVVPEDRPKVIDAWVRARVDCSARTTVRVAGSAGGRAVLHLIDVMVPHGVHVGVLVPVDGPGEQLEEAARIVAPPPRLVRLRKSDLALVLEVDGDVTAVLGWEPSDLVGQRTLELYHPDDRAIAIDTWMEVLSQPGATSRCRLRHMHRDGRWVWMELSNRNLLDGEGGGHVDCEMFDITEEVEALEAVRASEQLFRRLAAALPIGVWQIDVDGDLVYANRELLRITGSPADADSAQLLSCVVEADVLEVAIGAVLGGADVDLALEVQPADGSGRRRCDLALRALTSPDGRVTGAVGSVTDVTDASLMQAELEHRATYDELTSCVNRATAMGTLASALGTPGQDTAVIFVDVDRFKAVNDRLGHGAGDALLVILADRLRTAVRTGDVVGRVGGDEFLVVCPDVTSAAEGLLLGERIASIIRAPVSLRGEVLEPSASVGVAWAPGTVDADHLIACADAAMYESKGTGGGRAVLGATARLVDPDGDLSAGVAASTA
jgi:diguanylate cyclase (GGDEF)-like protein/PAS domain S-box-containing protein